MIFGVTILVLRILSIMGRGPPSLGFFNSIKAGRNRKNMRTGPKTMKMITAEVLSEKKIAACRLARKRLRLSSEIRVFTPEMVSFCPRIILIPQYL